MSLINACMQFLVHGGKERCIVHTSIQIDAPFPDLSDPLNSRKEFFSFFLFLFCPFVELG